MELHSTAHHFSTLTAARELSGFTLNEAPDIRGWTVIAYDGLPAGTVSRLMVDNRSRQVRYIGVVLDPSLERRRGFNAMRTVLVPVGLTERVDATHSIRLDHLTTESLRRAPRLPMRPITRSDEEATLAAYGMPLPSDLGNDDVYASPIFDASRLLAPTGGNGDFDSRRAPRPTT